METAALLVEAVRWWSIAGTVVAVAFLAIGIDRVEPNARDTYTFRVLLIPGILLLWPLVVWRWVVLELGRNDWQGRQTPIRNAHAWVWLVLAVAIPALLIAALASKPEWPGNYQPQQIEEPAR